LATCYRSQKPILTTLDNTGHVFRRQAAGAFGPDLAKKLSQLVKMEKNVMRSMELVGRERMEVAVSPNFFILNTKFPG
jgi:Eisosome component PIL1